MNADANNIAPPADPQVPPSTDPTSGPTSPEKKTTPTSHVVALILALLALLLAFVPIAGVLCALCALAFAIAVRITGGKKPQNKLTVAKASIVLAIFAVIGGSIFTGFSVLVAKGLQRELQSSGIDLSQITDIAKSVQKQAMEDKGLTQQERLEKATSEMEKFTQTYKRLSGKDFGLTEDEIENSLKKASDLELASYRQLLNSIGANVEQLPPETLDQLAVVLRGALQKDPTLESLSDHTSSKASHRKVKSDDHDDDDDDDKDDHDDDKDDDDKDDD